MITVGNIAMMVSIVGFGASSSFTAALLWRLLPSAFIGSPVAVSALVGESFDQEGQGKAFGMFTFGANLGSVAGGTGPSNLLWCLAVVTQHTGGWSTVCTSSMPGCDHAAVRQNAIQGQSKRSAFSVHC